MQINLKAYEDQKANGMMRVARLTDDLVIIILKQFNPSTGEPAPDLSQQVSLKDLDTHIDGVEKDLERTKAMRDDLRAAKIVSETPAAKPKK